MKKSDYIPEFIYTSSYYNKYLIQYEGDIELDLKGVPGLYVSKINDKYAILTVINVEMGLSNEFRYIKNLIFKFHYLHLYSSFTLYKYNTLNHHSW